MNCAKRQVDHFAQSIHFDNLSKISDHPPATSSAGAKSVPFGAKWLRDFEVQATVASEKMAIIGQGSLSKSPRAKLAQEVERAIANMGKIAGIESFFFSDPKTQSCRSSRS